MAANAISYVTEAKDNVVMCIHTAEHIRNILITNFTTDSASCVLAG